MQYILSPTKNTPVGHYAIQVDLSDTMKASSTFTFVIEILENNLKNKELLKKSNGKMILSQETKSLKVH